MATAAIGSVISQGGGIAGYAGGGTSAGAAGYGSAASGLTDAGGLIASGVQNLINRNQAKRDAKKAREWSEMMRATAYQTMVKDLELAGLNPILAVSGGSHPSSAPSGPVTEGRSRNDMGAAFRGAAGRALSSGRQLKMMDDQVATIAAGRREAEANASVAQHSVGSRVENAYHVAARTIAERALLEDQMIQTRANVKKIDVQRELDAYLIPAAKAEAELDATEFGSGARKFRRLMESIPVLQMPTRRRGRR